MDKVIVKHSAHGLGAFATGNLIEGERIMRFEGTPLNFEQTLALGNEESFALQTGVDAYIMTVPPLRYVNHSCDPNCGVDEDLYLVAMRDIAEGEELTYDYSTTMLERHWEMICHCGSPKCRGVVRDFDTIPAEDQRKYVNLSLVPRYIIDLKTSTDSQRNAKHHEG